MKFENTQVWGFEHAIRGMRNPLASWDKSDSEYAFGCIVPEQVIPFNIGEKDMDLCKRLISAGSEHRKFLRQIFVSVDITAPLYWWKEFDTYKVGTVANSTSTMHKIATTPITMDCFETDDMDMGLKIECWDSDFEEYMPYNSFEDISSEIIDTLEEFRRNYLRTKDKRYWKELIRWLPEGWLQKRTVTLNYENLLTIYKQRKAHKLNEWSGLDDLDKPNFIKWMLGLPYMIEFVNAAYGSNE